MFTMMLSIILTLVSLILVILSFLMSKKNNMDREKNSPFECGFDPLIPNRLPFSLRFFIIAVIFLVFDVEIVLLLPLSSIWEISNLNYWLIMYMVFLMILLMGTIYEWGLGALYWKM
uniref:NADH-ubiquinone oxidoreductase chain 3 n=1 Tax=Bragasellus peltatus TaxID=1282048 RepID=A0A485ME26_9CRUS|nr:NADH dehydrogenase subunit 3 [Bragasellus peltatus]